MSARRTFRRVVLAGVAVGAALFFSACGGSDKVTAQNPEVVAKAEKAVQDSVAAFLAAYSYPNTAGADTGMSVSGDATCTPISDYQLDCVQRFQDDPNYRTWTGESKWRATVEQSSGDVSVEEQGGTDLQTQMSWRSACNSSDLQCNKGKVE